MILFDLRDSGGSVKMVCHPRRSSGDRPFFRSSGDRPFFQTPLNPESQIVSLSPEGLVIICFIIPP